MRILGFFFLTSILVLGAMDARADGRAFPPDHCSTSSPFMAFTGIDGSNTFCDSGQDVFLNALPNCVANQQVVYDGSKFVCEDKTPVPNCPTGQVLTYLAGSGFTCVNGNASVPTCTKDQFLTYNGSAFQCSSITQIPSCADGQTLTFQGGQLTCATTGAARKWYDANSFRNFDGWSSDVIKNDTGCEMIVEFSGGDCHPNGPGCNNTHLHVLGYVDGQLMAYEIGYLWDYATRQAVTLVVPPGSTYQVALGYNVGPSGGGQPGFVVAWHELRCTAPQ